MFMGKVSLYDFLHLGRHNMESMLVSLSLNSRHSNRRFAERFHNYYNKKELYDTKADSIMKEEKESVFLVVFVSEEDE